MRAFRDLSRIAVTSLLAALALGPANAAIFASDLSVTGNGPYILHYVLNEAAESGTIIVAAAAPYQKSWCAILVAAHPRLVGGALPEGGGTLARVKRTKYLASTPPDTNALLGSNPQVVEDCAKQYVIQHRQLISTGGVVVSNILPILAT